MKISININTEKLALMNRLLSRFDSVNFHGLSPQDKKVISLMLEARKIFIKKTVNNMQNTKDFKLSLAYYVAYALHDFLQNVLMATDMDIYTQNILEMIRNQIHQKL